MQTKTSPASTAGLVCLAWLPLGGKLDVFGYFSDDFLVQSLSL